MVVNRDKTNIVHFRPVRSTKTTKEFMFGEYKYLGVYLDDHLTFKETVDVLAASASRALGYIRFKLKYLKECRCSTFTQLYSACVCPIMDYASGVWSTKPWENLEKIQYKALRYFLGVHRFAPIDVLVGDSGWLSCQSRHKLAMLRLWNRLVALPESRLTNHIFHWDLTYKNRPGSWSDVICKLFSDNGLDFYFENVQICELESVYVILKANECESWNNRRYTKPKLRYYNMYKSDLEQECYLNLNIPKYHRSLFAQFRAGILPLAVEVGRYRSLPLSERVCTLCQLQLVEDEYHILCVCGSYDEFRTTLYNKASTTFNEFHNIPELDKFVYLINNLQRDVIAFLVKALTKRRNYMYVWTHLPLPCSFVLFCVTNRDI